MIFCDLVGFTSRSEALDPDIVRELLSGYFDDARAIIGRHGGTIEKFIGDAVMAVWGVPIALENDAERAVRASLELVDAVHAFGEAHQLEGLAARVGVVTGQAVAMDSVEEGIVVGDRVNTAARIQGLAEPGTVYVDETTRAATAAAIAYRDAGEHLVKGKAEPVRVWRAERAIAGALGVNRGDSLEAELVGRDSELRLIKELFHTSTERRGARLLSIVGPAGVGKSRLAWEFYKYVDGLALNTYWHRGKCLSYGDGVAYWALAQIVRQRFGIGEQDADDAVRAKLRQGLDELISRPEERDFIEPRVAQLLGAADADLARDDLFAGWRLLFERLTETHPVVMVIDDLQWADVALLDFLDSILDWSSAHPIFILTLARPELAERRPGWGQRRNGTSIGLDPLDGASMLRLLDDLVDLPADLAEHIVNQAEGIPLYAVEIVRSLVDRGLVQADGAGPRLVGSLDDLEVPPTLTALLVARLDGLPPEERTLVRDLAVLGTSFPRAAIDAVAQPSGAQLDDLLASLVRREVLTVIGDPLSPERGQLQFAQGLMRTVVYDNLTRRERKHRHIAVADHLQIAYPDGGAEVVEVIAEHLRQALDADPGAVDAEELRGRAAESYQRSGDRAAALGAPAAAAAAYQQALDLVDDPGVHAELLLRAGETAALSGLVEEGVGLLDQATAELRALGRESEALLSVTAAARALANSGQQAAARARVEVELRALPPDASDWGSTRLLAFIGVNRVINGEMDDTTRDILDRATNLAEGLGDKRLLVDVLKGSAIRHLQLGNLVLARTLSSAALELAREVGDLERVSHLLGIKGQVLTGNDEPAEAIIEETLALGRRLGDPVVISIAMCNLTRELLRRGQWDELAKEVREHLDGTRRGTSATDGEPILHLALLAAWRGDHAEASRLVIEAERAGHRRPAGHGGGPHLRAAHRPRPGSTEPHLRHRRRAAPRRGGGRLRLAVRQHSAPVAGRRGRGVGGR